MLTTKRKSVPVGEFLREEFMAPLGLPQGVLAPSHFVGTRPRHRRR